LRITDQNGKTVDAGCVVLVAANSGFGAGAVEPDAESIASIRRTPIWIQPDAKY
jgi:hypothetical protein